MESMNSLVVKSGRMRFHARSLLVFSLITAISSGMTASAQTFAEWFSQKKTQKKYLLQQIAALQVYTTYLKKGYSIASNGLGSVSGYLRSENSLHATYYDHLQKVSPTIRDEPMVHDIINWQGDILIRTKDIPLVSGMTAAEKKYLADVCRAVLQDCDQQLQTLQQVIKDDQIKMSDAERLAAINKIHHTMQDNYRFVTAFSGQVRLLAIRRQQEIAQTGTSRKLYGINQ